MSNDYSFDIAAPQSPPQRSLGAPGSGVADGRHNASYQLSIGGATDDFDLPINSPEYEPERADEQSNKDAFGSAGSLDVSFIDNTLGTRYARGPQAQGVSSWLIGVSQSADDNAQPSQSGSRQRFDELMGTLGDRETSRSGRRGPVSTTHHATGGGGGESSVLLPSITNRRSSQTGASQDDWGKYEYVPATASIPGGGRGGGGRHGSYSSFTGEGFEDEMAHIIESAYAQARDESFLYGGSTSAVPTRGNTRGPSSKPVPRSLPISPSSRLSPFMGAGSDSGYGAEVSALLDFPLSSPVDQKRSHTLTVQRGPAVNQQPTTIPTSVQAEGRTRGDTSDRLKSSPSKDARFSPELVALTASGMDFAQMRWAAKQLGIAQDAGTGGSHSPVTGSRQSIGSSVDNGDGGGYMYGMDSPLISTASRTKHNNNSSGSGEGTAGRRATLLPSPQSATRISAANRRTQNSSPPLNGANPRRRWGDTGNNTSAQRPTVSVKEGGKPVENISPPPRSPQQPVTPDAQRHANSLPAARRVHGPTSGANTNPNDRDAGFESYDYGDGPLRRNSEPAPVRDPALLLGLRRGEVDVRPTAPHHETKMVSPFPAVPRKPNGGPPPLHPSSGTLVGSYNPSGVSGKIGSPSASGGSPRGRKATPQGQSATTTTAAPSSRSNGPSSGLPSSSTSRTSASERLVRPKPSRQQTTSQAVIPSGTVDYAAGAKQPERPNSSLEQPQQQPAKSVTTAKPADADGTSSSSGRGPSSPPKVTTLPVIANHKPGTPGSNPAMHPGGVVNGHPTSGKHTPTVNGSTNSRNSNSSSRATPEAFTPQVLLPRPPFSNGILIKAGVYRKGTGAQPRRPGKRRRSLPNGKRRANWVPPETHYVTCLSMPFEADEDEADEGEEDGNTLGRMGQDAAETAAAESEQPLPVTVVDSRWRLAGRRPSPLAGCTKSPSPPCRGVSGTSPAADSDDTSGGAYGSPLGSTDGVNGGLLVDEVEKLRLERRLMKQQQQQQQQDSPGTSSLYTPQGTPVVRGGKGSEEVTPLAAAAAATVSGRPVNRPSSRNSDNASNGSADAAQHSFMQAGRRGASQSQPSSTTARALTLSKGSNSSINSNPPGSATGVSFAPGTIFYEQYVDDYLEEEEEMDSGDLVAVDA